MNADADSPASSGPPILSLSDLQSINVPLIHEGARVCNHSSDFIFIDPFYYFQLPPDCNHSPYIFYTTLPQALKVLSPLLMSRCSLHKRKETIITSLCKGVGAECSVYGYIPSSDEESLFERKNKDSTAFTQEELIKNFLLIPTAIMATTIFTFLGELANITHWTQTSRQQNCRLWHDFAIQLVSFDSSIHVRKEDIEAPADDVLEDTDIFMDEQQQCVFSEIEYDSDWARVSTTVKGNSPHNETAGSHCIISQDASFDQHPDYFHTEPSTPMAENSVWNDQYKMVSYPFTGSGIVSNACFNYIDTALRDHSLGSNIIKLWQQLSPSEREIFDLAHLHLVYSEPLYNLDHTKKIEQIKLRYDNGSSGAMYNNRTREAVQKLVYAFSGIQVTTPSEHISCLLDNQKVVCNDYLELLRRFGYQAKTTQFHYALIATELFPKKAKVIELKAKAKARAEKKLSESNESKMDVEDIEDDHATPLNPPLFAELLLCNNVGNPTDAVLSEEDEEEEIEVQDLIDELTESGGGDLSESDIVRKSQVMMLLNSTISKQTNRLAAVIPPGYGIEKHQIFCATNVSVDALAYLQLFINSAQIRDYLRQGHKKVNGKVILNLIMTWDAADLTNVSLTQANECFSALLLQCTNMRHLSNSHLSNFLIGLNNQQDKGAVVRSRFYKNMIRDVFQHNGVTIGCEDEQYHLNILPFILCDYGLAKVLAGNESFDKQMCIGSPYTKIMVQSLSHSGFVLGNDSNFDLNTRLEIDFKIACERLLFVLLVGDRIEECSLDEVFTLFFPFSKGSLCSMIFHAAFDHDKRNKSDLQLGLIKMSALTLPPDFFHIVHNVGKHQLEKNSYISQVRTGNQGQVQLWNTQLKSAKNISGDNRDETDESDEEEQVNNGSIKVISSSFKFVGPPGKSNSAPIGLRAGMSDILFNQTPVEIFFPQNFAGSDEQGRLITSALTNLVDTLKRIFHLLGEKDPSTFRDSQGYLIMMLDMYDTQYTALYGASSILPYDIIFAHTLPYFIQVVIDLEQTYIATFNTNPNEANHPRIIEKFRRGGNHFTTPTPSFLQNGAVNSILQAIFFEHLEEATTPTFQERLQQSCNRDEIKFRSRRTHPTLIESDNQQSSFVALIHHRFYSGHRNDCKFEGDRSVKDNLIALVKTGLSVNERIICRTKSVIIRILHKTLGLRIVHIIWSFLQDHEEGAQAKKDKYFNNIVVDGPLPDRDFRGPYPDFTKTAEKTLSSTAAEHHVMLNLKSNKRLFVIGDILNVVAEANNLFFGNLICGFDFNNQCLKLTLHINVLQDDGTTEPEQYIILYKFQCINSIKVTLLIPQEPPPLPEVFQAVEPVPAPVPVPILYQAFERVFITVSFKYGPFSISKKTTTPVKKKIIWEKVDNLPLPYPHVYNVLCSELRLVCLVKNKQTEEFMNTLVRELPENTVGSRLRNKVTHVAQYLFRHDHEGVKNKEDSIVQAMNTFLQEIDRTQAATAIPVVFPLDEGNIGEENDFVVSTDMPILTEVTKSAKRVSSERLKELIFCMATEEDRKLKFQRKCRCGELLYISSRNGGNISVNDNTIHNKCDHIPEKGCCPL